MERIDQLKTIKRKLRGILLRPGPAEVVAVDFGETSVRLIHAARRRGRLRVLSFGERALPRDAMAAGASYWAQAGKCLAEMVGEFSLSGKACYASMLGRDVQLKHFGLPPMPLREMRRALELEWKRLVDQAGWKGRVVFELIKSPGETRYSQILSAAAEEGKVRDCASAVRSSGLSLERIVPPGLACRALVRANAKHRVSTAEALLDVANSMSRICVFRNRELVMHRELTVGGKSFTDVLTRIVLPEGPNVHFDPEEAEELKRKFGIPLTTSECKDSRGEVFSGEHVLIMMRPVLERLLREVWSSIEYSGEQLMGDVISTIYLSGGGARLRGLDEHMKSVFKIDVKPISALIQNLRPSIECDGNIAWELYAPCLGLAMLRYGGMDLAELSPARRAQNALGAVRLATATGLAVALCAGSLALGHRYESRWQAVRAKKTVELEGLSQTEQEIRVFREALRLEEMTRASIRQVSGATVLWSTVMRDLSSRFGNDVRLTGMNVEIPNAPGSEGNASPRLVMTGYLRTNPRRLEEVLAQMMKSLGSSPHLTDVRLISSEAVDKSVANFSVTCGLKEE